MAYENFISHSLEPGSLGSGCRLVRFRWKVLYQFAETSGIILISRIQMVNCINVKEYCKITFFSHSFTCLIFTCPWVPQWLCISWYLPISIFSTIPCHFILSRYLITCICPDFASPANLRKIWPGFYFCFYILYFKNISFSFFCPCNDNQFHLYHSTHIYILFWTQVDPSNLINKLSFLKSEASLLPTVK